jgi:hypothetical protein
MSKVPGSAYDKWNISVTQIFHSGQTSHGGDRKTFEVMTSTYLRGTLGSVASLLAATVYQGNPDRNLKLWNIVSTIYSICRCCWKVPNGKIEIICGKVSFLTAPHCQFRGVGQGMKHTLSVSVVSFISSSMG